MSNSSATRNGWTPPSTRWCWPSPPVGLVVAHSILAVPYVVLLMSVAIQSFDIRIEQVALTLGASKRQMLTRVLVPNLVPSALASWIFAFIISFDEVVVTQFVAGPRRRCSMS
jgi:ABC-type spermidine/putrescine transport system permease subunit II